MKFVSKLLLTASCAGFSVPQATPTTWSLRGTDTEGNYKMALRVTDFGEEQEIYTNLRARFHPPSEDLPAGILQQARNLVPGFEVTTVREIKHYDEQGQLQRVDFNFRYEDGSPMHDLTINDEGNVVNTEIFLKASDIPDHVVSAMKENGSLEWIDKATRITAEYEGNLETLERYDFTWDDETGKQLGEMELSTEGEVLRAPGERHVEHASVPTAHKELFYRLFYKIVPDGVVLDRETVVAHDNSN